METLFGILIKVLIMGAVFSLFGFLAHLFKQLTNKEYREKLKVEKEIEQQLKTQGNKNISTTIENNKQSIKKTTLLKRKFRRLKISFKSAKNLNFSIDEIIVMSVVFGAICFLVFGYGFEEVQYFSKSGVRVSSSNEYYQIYVFNIVVGLASFIIGGGLSFIALKNLSKLKTTK